MFESLPPRRLLSTTQPLLADFTADGKVDAADFNIVAGNFGRTGIHASGDATGDGIVNALDFNVLATEFGQSGFGKLVFSDEFISPTLSPTWTPSQYWWPDDHTVYGGDELEGYDATGVSVSDGAMHLTARKETKYGEPYVSGLVQTDGKQDHPTTWPKFSFKFGYLEAARFPAGQGLWPAIWLMPASYHDNNGELDVMENLGNDTHTVYFTAHRNGKQQGHHLTSGADFSAGFHTFAVDWQADHITWYVDSIARATCTDKTLICPEACYPILNLAVGGNWPGYPDATTRFPASMDVDYVRVFQ